MRRINQGRLKVLRNEVFEISENPNFFYMPQGVSNIIRKFASKHMIPIKPDYYLVNCIMGEYTCLDFIWYRSLHSFCKHGHAALASNAKNHIIYTGFDEKAYTEILCQHKINRIEVFFLTEIQTMKKDPFRPNELPRQRHATIGPSRINDIDSFTLDINESNSNSFTESISLLTISEHITSNNKLKSHNVKLFETNSINWNRKEFVKECQSQNICLNDNDIVNTTKLISWFDRKKNKAKHLMVS
ncbi:12111_t:CDS:2, partial [Gigaspora margarita]